MIILALPVLSTWEAPSSSQAGRGRIVGPASSSTRRKEFQAICLHFKMGENFMAAATMKKLMEPRFIIVLIKFFTVVSTLH